MTCFTCYSGIRNLNIYIGSQNLLSGVDYRLIVFAETPGSPNATVELDYLVNLPPYGGSCTALPLNGNRLTYTTTFVGL